MNLRLDMPYKGMENYSTPEMKKFVYDLIHRLTVNAEGLNNQLNAALPAAIAASASSSSGAGANDDCIKFCTQWDN